MFPISRDLEPFDTASSLSPVLPYPVGYESYDIKWYEETNFRKIAPLIENGSLPEGTTRAQLWATGIVFKNLVFADGRVFEEAFFDIIYAVDEEIVCILPSPETDTSDYPDNHNVDPAKTWQLLMPILTFEGIYKDGVYVEEYEPYATQQSQRLG